MEAAQDLPVLRIFDGIILFQESISVGFRKLLRLADSRELQNALREFFNDFILSCFYFIKRGSTGNRFRSGNALARCKCGRGSEAQYGKHKCDKSFHFGSSYLKMPDTFLKYFIKYSYTLFSRKVNW